MMTRHGSPSLRRNVRRRRVDTVRDFPVNCAPTSLVIAGDGSSSCAVTNRTNKVPLLSNCSATVSDKMCQIPATNSPSTVRRPPKVDFVRDFPENCGPVGPREKSEGVGEEIALDDDSCSFEVKWKQDLERLSLVLAQAKEYCFLVTKDTSPKEVFAVEESNGIVDGKDREGGAKEVELVATTISNRSKSNKLKSNKPKEGFQKKGKTKMNVAKVPKATDKCLHCQELGHWKRDCPDLRASIDKCLHCQELGHWKMDCPDLRALGASGSGTK